MSKEREIQLLAELARRDDRIAALENENRFLQEKIDALVRRIFGRSSEKINDAQMVFEALMGKSGLDVGLLENPVAEAEPAEAEVVRPPRRRSGRQRLPEHLPVEEEIILPLEVQAAPEDYRRIGEEVSERLDYHPARYLRLRTVRPKFVSIKNKRQAPVVAPVGPQLAEKLGATPAMIAHVIVSKYADHLPLYRQEAILQKRHGLPISRQTLCQWMGLAAHWLRLVYQQVQIDVLEGDAVQVDETPLRYLDPGRGRCSMGYLWAVHRPYPSGEGRGPSFFQWHTSRSADCLEAVLGQGFAGIVQCDGYAAYESYARSHGVLLAACWAHVRRKFYEAREYDALMLEALGLIARLYAVEKRLREAGAPWDQRREVRQAQSAPILETLHARLLDWQGRDRFLPGSCAGKAISYTLGLWDKLCLFIDKGNLEIDNNLCENVIRPSAVGKKNWLFIGDGGAGQTSAILFTLVNECNRLGLNPQDYLTRVLQLLPQAMTSDIPGLTPSGLAPLLLPSGRLDQAA